MKKKFLMAVASAVLLPSLAMAQVKDETVVGADKSVNMSLSVYNDNLAFVKDVRRVDLKNGMSSVAFVGVASQMRPETAMLKSSGIVVVEQNYEYNVINPDSMLRASIGKTVKTAITDRETGATTFSQAEVVESDYGAVLKFDYGIETNFPGRVIFDEIPSTLRTKPTFLATIHNDKNPTKDIELNYLTRGLTWKADYVANIRSENTMDLESFITLTNTSGIDYKDTSLHFISGTVNQVYGQYPMQPMMINKGYARMDMVAESAMAGGEYGYAAPSMGSVGEYHVYTVPTKTTIKDQQTKQIKLFNKDAVKFEKEYRFNSPISVSTYASKSDFTKSNPTLIYKIKNDTESNLGLSLPSGVVRFYDKDNQGNNQFIGESNINQLAVNEKGELSLGVASDVFARGRVADVNIIAKNIKELEMEVTVHNSKSSNVTITYEQPIYDTWTIISESHKSEKKSQNVAKWEIDIPSNGKVDLKFKVRVSRDNV